MSEVLVRRSGRVPALSCAMLMLTAFQQTPTPPHPILLVNATGQTITHFYASTVGFNVWEEDMLGQDVIAPGAAVRIHIDNGSGRCRYDLRARLADGTEPYRPGVNICEITEYRFVADPPRPGPKAP